MIGIRNIKEIFINESCCFLDFVTFMLNISSRVSACNNKDAIATIAETIADCDVSIRDKIIENVMINGINNIKVFLYPESDFSFR